MSAKMDRTRIIELAEKQVKAGKLEDAIAEYRKLLTGDISDMGINNIIGDLYLKLGRPSEAVNAFQNVATYYESKGYHSQALAIYKKMHKVSPEEVIYIVRMADLNASQGFPAEAKKEYLKAERMLREKNRHKELLYLYDKLIKVDRENTQFRLALAELLQTEGFMDEAVIQLNEVAGLQMRKGDLKEAEKIIRQALGLKEEDEHAQTILVEILKRQGRTKDAINYVSEILAQDPTNVHFQIVLGTLHIEDQNLEGAEEIFAEIIAGDPHEARARVKLGKVYSLQNKPEKAFELFEPLIASMLKKHKEEKIIGLLGIILSAKSIYLPALEKLGAIYKSRDQKANMEIVYRIILEEARARHLTEKMFVALTELMELRPDDQLAKEYENLRKEVGFLDEKAGEEEGQAAVEAGEEDIDFLLAKVDLYISQGLIRNARRILENLSLKFPRNAKIEEKFASLEKVKPKIKTEEIPHRVERIQEMETKIEATPELAKTILSLLRDEGGAEERVTSADIFAETDILPLPSEGEEAKKYYDLEEKIQDELDMLRTVFRQQLEGDIAILEKELSDIVRDFRVQIQKKIDPREYETHFHLGLAFLEQGLVDEGIEEFIHAAEDKDRCLECYSIVSKACRQKSDFPAAFQWLEKALKLVEEGSLEYYALEYELACLHEEAGDRGKALELFHKIKDWDPEYREVVSKVENLTKTS